MGVIESVALHTVDCGGVIKSPNHHPKSWITECTPDAIIVFCRSAPAQLSRWRLGLFISSATQRRFCL